MQYQDHMLRAVRWIRRSGKCMSHGEQQASTRCHELARRRIGEKAIFLKDFVIDEQNTTTTHVMMQGNVPSDEKVRVLAAAKGHALPVPLMQNSRVHMRGLCMIV